MNEPEKNNDVVTWEELNPDWTEDGDLTDRFAKSQLDDCPSCGKFEQLAVVNSSGDDQSASVICYSCRWQVNGETPSEAVENWNRRATNLATAALGELKEAVRELLCQRCSQEYPVWFAPNPLWNKVQREGEHFLCPTCFAVLAEERGVKPTAWFLRLENKGDGERAQTQKALGELLHVVKEHLTCKDCNGNHFAREDGYGGWEQVQCQRCAETEVRIAEAEAFIGGKDE